MTTLHLVSHSHWDREWYLTFQQFRLRLVHLVDHVLDLLATDPEFKHFTLDGQAIVLEDYLQMRPERENELRGHLQSGRLLAGPWYLQPDEFLVSPEAILRNLSQGERTLERYGGSRMMVGYLPDTFGHIGQMPQILRGFGIESACLMRGLDEEPCELWWEAPNGSRVLLAYLRDGYGNAAGLPTAQPDLFLAEIIRLRDALRPHSAGDHLLLMHGTDHTVPPTETSAALRAAIPRLEASGDCLMHSTLPAYLQAIREEVEAQNLELPVVTGELRSSRRVPLLPGVLSARMWLKQRNHACQELLEKWAEPFSAWAELTAREAPPAALFAGLSRRVRNPAGILRQAWRQLLECHPHDSICGCSIDQVYEEIRPRFDQVEQIGEEITRQGLELLAAQIDTRQPGSTLAAIIVFNPSAGPRSDLVEARLELPAGLEYGRQADADHPYLEFIDETGAVLPHEVIETTTHEFFHLTFTRDELRSVLGSIQGGQVESLFIREVTFNQDGEVLHIDVVMVDAGKPDPELLRQGWVKLEQWLADETVRSFQVRGRSALQARVLIAARDVPQFGYRTFWLRPTAAPRGSITGVQPENIIENEFYVVEVSPQDGTASLVEKRTGVCYPGLNRFVDGGDAGDLYNYAPPAADELIRTAAVSDLKVHRSPAVQMIEASLALEVPTGLAHDRQRRSPERTRLPITTRYALVPGLPRLEIQTLVDNGPSGGPARVRDHRLRAHFPAPFSESELKEALYDGHYELVRRPVKAAVQDGSWIEQPRPEKPQRAFTCIHNGRIGLILANRGLPEVEVIPGETNTEIALTLMRSVGWLSRDDLTTRRGHAGPMLATPQAQMPGLARYEYALLPYDPGQGGDSSLRAFQHAFSFSTPMRAVGAPLHAGSLPARASLIAVSPQAFHITAIKTAEDGRGWVVRGYNLTSQPIQVTLFPWRPHPAVARVDLREQVIERLPVAEDGSVSLAVSGCEIATVKFSV